MKNKIIYKRIQLHPTLWSVDVFISKNKNAVAEKMAELYIETKDFYKKQLEDFGNGNFVRLEDNDKDKSGDFHIVCVLENFDVFAMAHEAVHITWALDAQVGFKMNRKNQEIQAYMVDYIMREIIKLKPKKQQAAG